MSKRQIICCAVSVLALASVLAGACSNNEDGETSDQNKVGVLFIHVGSDETYRPDWSAQFFANLYDFFTPGFFAGGALEGGTCYTLIHYADQAEADICNVALGTPVDVFCNEYTKVDQYPMQSLEARGSDGDDSFFTDCYDNPVIPYFPLLYGHSTIDPQSGDEILGPHVDDPEGPGIGIADFLELMNFDSLHRYHRLPQYKDVHREQALKWWYGNDAPAPYSADSEELSNIKDRLLEVVADADLTLVFRHGWESYMENTGPYGNPIEYADSTETALKELIDDEGVSKIVVAHTYPSFSNLTQYGHDWLNEDGAGVSAVAGQTFKECVEDISDDVGPSSQALLDEYQTKRPWDKHWKHPFPLIRHMAEELNPAVEVVFAPAYGEFPEFGASVIEMLKYTVTKYNIPETASLKVILAHHGYQGAFADAQNCDSYTPRVNALWERVRTVFESDFSWTGKYELVHGAGEYAEAATAGQGDKPSEEKPFGEVMSVGEHIDKALNGIWVNALGQLVDNGVDNYEYIVVLPYYFETESADTLFGLRESLGVMMPDEYLREGLDADGSEFDTSDIDEENFTSKTFDATGFTTTPEDAEESVHKGSATNPSTVIISGAVLSIGNGQARTKLTEAAVNAIHSKM